MNIAALFYPDKCIFCRRVLETGTICDRCAEAIPRCTGSDLTDGCDFIERCFTPLYYSDDVREAIHRFKFADQPSYAGTFAGLMAKVIQKQPAFHPDCITWVPVSARRKRRRGYDQAELLARALSELLELPCEQLLTKVRHNPENSSIAGADARRANVADAYRAPDGASIADRRILLVDDVFTTGATMSECARTLLMAGAFEVYGTAAARARRH